jgi:hypothetical protein
MFSKLCFDTHYSILRFNRFSLLSAPPADRARQYDISPAPASQYASSPALAHPVYYCTRRMLQIRRFNQFYREYTGCGGIQYVTGRRWYFSRPDRFVVSTVGRLITHISQSLANQLETTGWPSRVGVATWRIFTRCVSYRRLYGRHTNRCFPVMLNRRRWRIHLGDTAEYAVTETCGGWCIWDVGIGVFAWMHSWLHSPCQQILLTCPWRQRDRCSPLNPGNTRHSARRPDDCEDPPEVAYLRYDQLAALGCGTVNQSTRTTTQH